MITMKDLRSLGYCAVGARRVCKASGVDFKRLVSTGLTMDEIVAKAPEKYKREILEAYGDRENGK